MKRRQSHVFQYFHLDISKSSYELVCKIDGATAIRRVGRFTCPICGNNVEVGLVKTVVFGFICGMYTKNLQAMASSVTGRLSHTETYVTDVHRIQSADRSRAMSTAFKKVYGDPHVFNYPIQVDFAEIEKRILLQQFGKVTDVTSALPNHEEELSEKDDDAGRNDYLGSCLCKSHCRDHSNTD